jgi:diacylglycerol kinase (ATP)
MGQAHNNRILVIHNPVAGRRRQAYLERVLAAMRARDAHVAVQQTTRAGEAQEIARKHCKAKKSPYDIVVAAGGDGTINEVINGLGRKKKKTTPLAIIPLGTANVLAGELDLPISPEEVGEIIVGAKAERVYFGQAGDRRFSMMAGIGFDAHVVANVDPKLKRLTGKLAYFWQTLCELRRYKRTRYEIEVDGHVYSAYSAIVANGHYYGGRFICAPDARLSDPTLHVCLFQNGRWWDVVYYGLSLVLNRLHRAASVKIIPAREVVLKGPPGQPIQGDGDIIGETPVRITISPQKFGVVRPEPRGQIA